MTRREWLRDKRTFRCLFKIRIIKDYEWAVSTKLEGDLFQAIGAVSSYELSNSCLPDDLASSYNIMRDGNSLIQ
jgi:hypothetical protein